MFVFNKNIDMNEKDQRNALVVKLVDTKDLKAEGFTINLGKNIK